MNIIKELKHLTNNDYKEFSKKIIPTNHEVLGICIHAMQKLAPASSFRGTLH